MTKVKLLFFVFLLQNFIFAQKTSSINYVYPKKISLRVHILKGGARIFIVKIDPSKKLAKKEQVNNPASIPRRYFKEFNNYDNYITKFLLPEFKKVFYSN
jgi:hypothetical protein